MPTTLQAKERKKQRRAASMQSLDRAYEVALHHHHGPRYTMRARVEFGSQIKKKMSENDITSGPLDLSPLSFGPATMAASRSQGNPPKWSIRARTCKLLQLPGMTMDSVPGPGTYPVPTTMHLSHPSMKMPGKTRFSSAPRFAEVESD